MSGWGYAIGAGIQATAQGIQGILDYNENIKNRALQERINRQNYEAQKEFYKNSIQWRKQDALKAGINPIYALGGTSASFTPSFTASQETAPQVAGIGTSLGNAFIAYQQYKQQQQLQDKQLESMDASINKDNQQAEYYAALAEKTRGTTTNEPTIKATNAKTGETIATTTGKLNTPTPTQTENFKTINYDKMKYREPVKVGAFDFETMGTNKDGRAMMMAFFYDKNKLDAILDAINQDGPFGSLIRYAGDKAFSNYDMMTEKFQTGDGRWWELAYEPTGKGGYTFIETTSPEYDKATTRYEKTIWGERKKNLGSWEHYKKYKSSWK